MNSIFKTTINCVQRKKLLLLSVRQCTTYTHIDSIQNLLMKQVTVKQPDWGAVRKEALEIDTRKINANNVDYLLLSQCNEDSTRKLAVDFAKYLETERHGLNLAVIGRLLKIYGFVQRQEEPKCLQNINVEAEILKLYKQLTEKHKILDVSLTESVIYALSSTSQWRECLNLLHALKNYGRPTGSTYNFLIQALFQQKEEELAWNLMEEMLNKDIKPGDLVYLSCLDFIDGFNDCKEFSTRIERFFNLCSANDILISHEIATKIQRVFERREKTTNITKINVRGNCPKCKTTLPETVINDEDFNRLKSAFFQRVIVGKDVFRKTTPTELAHFKTFLQESQRYDVIIDGLNVAYSTGTNKPVHVSSGLVASVVEHYARQNKTILVLGRNHMKQWPHIRHIKKYAKLFLTQNLSQDDPYLLYCALNSGRGTIVVSRDMMRGHLHLLKEAHLKQLFKRWLSITRHQLVTQKRDGKLIINAPPAFIHSAQKHENVWHLPIIEEKREKDAKNNFSMVPEVYLWLCVQL